MCRGVDKRTAAARYSHSWWRRHQTAECDSLQNCVIYVRCLSISMIIMALAWNPNSHFVCQHLPIEVDFYFALRSVCLYASIKPSRAFELIKLRNIIISAVRRSFAVDDDVATSLIHFVFMFYLQSEKQKLPHSRTKNSLRMMFSLRCSKRTCVNAPRLAHNKNKTLFGPPHLLIRS